MEPVLLEKDPALAKEWERGVGKEEWVVLEWEAGETAFVLIVRLKFPIKEVSHATQLNAQNVVVQ
jgi:hypothetical protein